jgi:hypothetical protein
VSRQATYVIAGALSALGLLLAPVAACATDTYADSSKADNNGDCLTPATACKTINGVDGALAKTGGSGTIRLETGSYAENVTLPGGVSLTADGAAAATIDPSSGFFAVRVTGAPTTIQGLTFSSNVPNQTELVLEDGAGSPLVSDNHFIDTTPANGDNQAGIHTTAQGAPQISFNTFSGLFHGIDVVSPNTGAPGSPVITGNAISGVHDIGDGIQVSGSHNLNLTGPTTATLIGNTIHDHGAGQTTGVFLADGGSFSNDGTSPATGMTMIRNRITGGTNGIEVIGNRAPVTLFGDVITRTAPLTGGTAVLASSVEDGTTPGLYYGGDLTVTNADIVNNTNLSFELQDNHLTLDSSIVRGGAILPFDGDGTATCTITFSDGMTSGPDPCDSFQTTAVPSFVDATADDFHLTPSGNSALIDEGNPLAPPVGSTDFDGDPRAIDADATCPLTPLRDIGADEVNNGIPDCPSPPGPGTQAGSGPTGQRAIALKRCKKKFRHNKAKRKKCRKRAKLLPV